MVAHRSCLNPEPGPGDLFAAPGRALHSAHSPAGPDPLAPRGPPDVHKVQETRVRAKITGLSQRKFLAPPRTGHWLHIMSVTIT